MPSSGSSVTHNQEKNQSKETDWKITEVMELADRMLK